ncbi:mobilization protein A, partial [Acinetobacter ursingii]
MADFEKSLLCGLEHDQYDITWIENKDKGRLELNFVIPKVELNTGKAMNPYYDPIERKRVNAFKDHTNAKYDLHDPND